MIAQILRWLTPNFLASDVCVQRCPDQQIMQRLA